MVEIPKIPQGHFFIPAKAMSSDLKSRGLKQACCSEEALSAQALRRPIQRNAARHWICRDLRGYI